MVSVIFPLLIVFCSLNRLALGYACLGCGNCANDPNTVCEIDSDAPVCLPAEFLHLGGGCTAQVTQTTTITYIIPTDTSTSYTSSVDSFVTVSNIVYETAVGEETLTVQDVSTLIVTQTSTVQAPAITPPPTSTVLNEDQIEVTETSVETSTDVETVTAEAAQDTEIPSSISTPAISTLLARSTSTRQSTGPV